MFQRGRRVALLLFLVAATIGIDQCAKLVARAVLPPAQRIAVFPGVALCLIRNAGAFLSFGSSLPAGVRFWGLTVGVSLGLLGLFAWLLVSRRISAGGSAALSLVVGGGISNLLDRLVHGGEVTDFIVIGIGRFRTGVFNFADLAISAGTVILLVSARRGRPQREEPMTVSPSV